MDFFIVNVFIVYVKRFLYFILKFIVFFSIVYKLVIIVVFCLFLEYLINLFFFKIMFCYRWGFIFVDNV